MLTAIDQENLKKSIPGTQESMQNQGQLTISDDQEVFVEQGINNYYLTEPLKETIMEDIGGLALLYRHA